MNKIKVSATIKPTYTDRAGLEDLLNSGVDIIRLPFWKISEEQMIKNIELIKSHNLREKANIEILIDLPGNKIRFGYFYTPTIEFVPDREYKLFEGDSASNPYDLPVEFSGFIALCSVGDEIICGDGEVVLKIISKNPSSVMVRTEYPASVSSKKGLSITGKDSHLLKQNLCFIDYGIKFVTKYDIDWLALSFTSNPEQVMYIRSNLQQDKNSKTKVMAKIESKSGIDNLDKITDVSDGIMIARGDMISYLNYSLLGLYQMRIIKSCKERNRFCMLSTGIMNGILSKARPTPAEILDITNAVLSGVDSIQFCEETALSRNPGYVVRVAKKIIDNVQMYEKVLG
jgi:pyruvate kinase